MEFSSVCNHTSDYLQNKKYDYRPKRKTRSPINNSLYNKLSEDLRKDIELVNEENSPFRGFL